MSDFLNYRQNFARKDSENTLTCHKTMIIMKNSAKKAKNFKEYRNNHFHCQGFACI